MSEIKFACIHCGQKLCCDGALTGQRLSCPACQRSVLVPWAPLESVAGETSAHQTLAASPAHLPKISIPELSLPDPQESKVRPPPKRLQLQGRNRSLPGFSVLAVLSFALSLLGPIGFIPAIVCGHLAKWQMRRNAALRGASLATSGLAIAYTSALLTGVFVARTLLQRLE